MIYKNSDCSINSHMDRLEPLSLEKCETRISRAPESGPKTCQRNNIEWHGVSVFCKQIRVLCSIPVKRETCLDKPSRGYRDTQRSRARANLSFGIFFFYFIYSFFGCVCAQVSATAVKNYFTRHQQRWGVCTACKKKEKYRVVARRTKRHSWPFWLQEQWPTRTNSCCLGNNPRNALLSQHQSLVRLLYPTVLHDEFFFRRRRNATANDRTRPFRYRFRGRISSFLRAAPSFDGIRRKSN